ncbi:MFS transporter [Sphingomonas quercus]|uniref:MFS transporter n=1 Tax=Sphingomonas quercus TaxID=2842451 RepID=A0ABS6BH07_9SPHN|nr:MFS transporter [Sphingomonas quercus]MBU3077582.1 MFS transporter [Sphingomonas quercus]
MPRFRRLRWMMIVLVMAAMILNYLSRSVLGIAAPAVMDELHIGPEQYGWVTGAFQLGIMLQPLAGYVVDIIGVKLGFALFAGAWSIITIAHGLAGGWLGLAALRGALGLAEGAGHPSSLKVVAAWFPARERGIAGGLYNIGASFGAVLAPPLVAWAIWTSSWRMAFVVAGALGLLWVILWLVAYAPPETHPRLSDEERAYIQSDQEAFPDRAAGRASLGQLLRQRNLWGIAIPRMLADPTWGTLSFWMPLYLTTVRHFDLAQIALFAWLPFLAADLGCLFGPFLVLMLQRMGVGLIDARRGAFTAGAVMMVAVAFVGTVESPVTAVALLCLAGFAHQTLSVTVITMSSDLFPPNEVGTVAGVAGLFGNFGVLAFSLMIGQMVERVGYSPFFVALGGLDLVGALVLWTVVRAPKASI